MKLNCDRGCVNVCLNALERNGRPCTAGVIAVDLATREPIEPETPTRPTAVAAGLVDGDRQDSYGHPLVNHERIAAFWTVRLLEKLKPGEVIEPHEAAALMRLAKEARLMQTDGHGDSMTDIAGYADVEHAIHLGYEQLPASPYSNLFGFTRGEVE